MASIDVTDTTDESAEELSNSISEPTAEKQRENLHFYPINEMKSLFSDESG